MVEQRIETDIVGQVINAALTAAVKDNNNAQAEKLLYLQRTYHQLVEDGMKPTNVERLERPLRDKLIEGLNPSYDQLLRRSFATPKGPLDLTVAEHRTLALLVAHPDQTVSRQTIYNVTKATAVGKQRLLTNLRAVDARIGRLRAKLATNFPGPPLIWSVRGVGYAYKDPEHVLRVVEPLFQTIPQPQTDEQRRADQKLQRDLDDMGNHALFVNGLPLKLTQVECRILAELARHKIDLATKDDLAKAAWVGEAAAVNVSTGVIAVHICRIRKKLGQLKDAPTILAMRGRGFKLIDPHATLSTL